MTVNCAERGLLLLRVRDELKMTLAAYQTLYQSSIAFGMRKALQVCIAFLIHGKIHVKKYWNVSIIFIGRTREGRFNCSCRWIQLQKAELEKAVVELKQKFEQAERRAAELREAEEKKHMEEIQFLKKTNQQLKVNIYA